MSFYKKPKWINKRIVILKRDVYQCQECKRYGKSTTAIHVHHIVPLEWCLVFKPLWAYLSKNLISLCSEHHSAMHDRTNNKLTAQGIRLLIRVFGDEGKELIHKYNL